MMIKVVAKNMVINEKVEEFITLAKTLVEATNQKDKGCLHYELYQDIGNPQILTFMEEWQSMEASDEHMAAAHFKEIVPKFDDLTEGPSEVHLYTKL
jgi:quinol monooxygenase YgiN